MLSADHFESGIVQLGFVADIVPQPAKDCAYSFFSVAMPVRSVSSTDDPVKRRLVELTAASSQPLNVCRSAWTIETPFATSSNWNIR